MDYNGWICSEFFLPFFFFWTPFLLYIFIMTHCKTTSFYIWHNNHASCRRDRDLALCCILLGKGGELENTRREGYTFCYYWTRWQAGYWSWGTRWKGLNTGNLFTTLLRTSKLLITNWAVSFTFLGLLKTSRSFNTSDRSKKNWVELSFYLANL